MKRRIYILSFLVCCCLSLTGCANNHYKKDITELAESFVLEKYGEIFSVVESEQLTQYVQRWFPHKSKDCRIIFQDGDSTFNVWYNAELDRFYDDRQADEINGQIRESILKPLHDQLMPCEWDVESCCFGSVDDFCLSLKGCFFHTRYQGDIEAFCRAEKPAPNFGGLNAVLFTEDENRTEWESRMSLLSDTASEFFSLPQYTMYGTRHSAYLTVAVYKEEEWRADPRCEFLARLMIDENSTQIYTPSWIEIADGVFVTASEKSPEIELRPGDVKLERVYSPEEFSLVLRDYPDSNGKQRDLSIRSDVYTIQFSEQLSAQLEGESLQVVFQTGGDAPYGNLTLYKIDLQEEKKVSSLWLVSSPNSGKRELSIYENPINGSTNYYCWLG